WLDARGTARKGELMFQGRGVHWRPAPAVPGEHGNSGRYLHCARSLTAVRSLAELADGCCLAASSTAAQAAAGSPFWNRAQARLVQASAKSGASLTACSSTGCASFGRLAIKRKRP